MLEKKVPRLLRRYECLVMRRGEWRNRRPPGRGRLGAPALKPGFSVIDQIFDYTIHTFRSTRRVRMFQARDEALRV